MAIQALESGHEGREDIGLSREEAAAQLGADSTAQVILFPEQQAELAPGMQATIAFVAWARNNPKFSVAEYKHDEGGLYVDHHGPKVYLA